MLKVHFISSYIIVALKKKTFWLMFFGFCIIDHVPEFYLFTYFEFAIYFSVLCILTRNFEVLFLLSANENFRVQNCFFDC